MFFLVIIKNTRTFDAFLITYNVCIFYIND